MTERWDSLPAMLLGLAARWRDRPMLRHWVRDGSGGDWQRMSWAGFAHAVAAAAAGLRARGVMPGDRVLLVSENRPEFPIADTAIMAIGAVTVPTYTTNTVADHAPYPARQRRPGGHRLHRRAGRPDRRGGTAGPGTE